MTLHRPMVFDLWMAPVVLVSYNSTPFVGMWRPVPHITGGVLNSQHIGRNHVNPNPSTRMDIRAIPHAVAIRPIVVVVIEYGFVIVLDNPDPRGDERHGGGARSVHMS